ncbi:MAG: hypothetical protein WCF23_19260 [Candidatus Nitrosopolaris sp.]
MSQKHIAIVAVPPQRTQLAVLRVSAAAKAAVLLVQVVQPRHKAV